LQTRTPVPAITAVLLLAIAAGAITSVSAQTVQPSTREVVLPTTVDFRSSQWLADRKVVNNNGENIAVVSDLILDRGSGRIEYLVVKTGTTLGMGGRAIVIPYGAFTWEGAGKDNFKLAATPEQLKQYPEFSSESWMAMKDAAKTNDNALRERLTAECAAPTDPYAASLNTASKERVEGTVTKVERIRSGKLAEQVVLTIQTSDKSLKRVALGPSWYVNSTPVSPMRGDKVSAETLALPRDTDQLLVATSFKSGDRKLALRETDGTPVWALKTVDACGEVCATPYSRFLLMSDLAGKNVVCRGDECGKVHQIILDRNSGEIGFLSIDPNKNFLGISDTKRLIPWSVATASLDGNVRIDASKEMVLASPETPSELPRLNTGTHAARVYQAFDVPAPRFETVKAVTPVLPGKDNAWAPQGTILAAIEPGPAKSFEGKVIDLTEVKFEKGVQPALAVRIKLTGDGAGEETILLGPSWYMENQKPLCQNGDLITLDACRTTIDGRRCWLAKSVGVAQSRVVLLDGSNKPAWAQP
jgi:sporulation protein YlmC with PRC-barrel domain